MNAKRPKIKDEPLTIVELHIEKYGNEYRAIIKLSNGEEREAIADTPTSAQIKALHGLDCSWTIV